MNKLDILKKSPLGQELNDEQIRVIADIGSEEIYEVGDNLTKQGRIPEKLYLIEEGLVGLYLEIGPLANRQLQSASNFEFVGVSTMLSSRRYTTTVKAIETTKVLAFDGKELARLCENDPVIGHKFYRVLASAIAERLEHAFTQLMGITAQE